MFSAFVNRHKDGRPVVLFLPALLNFSRIPGFGPFPLYRAYAVDTDAIAKRSARWIVGSTLAIPVIFLSAIYVITSPIIIPSSLFQNGVPTFLVLLFIFGIPYASHFLLIRLLKHHLGELEEVDVQDLLREPPGVFRLQLHSIPVTFFSFAGGAIFGIAVIEPYLISTFPNATTGMAMAFGIAAGSAIIIALAKFLKLPYLPRAR